MANEITVNTELQIQLAYTRIPLSSRVQFDLTANPPSMSPGIIEVGFAAHEAIALGDVGAVGGVCYFQNLDDTNYVEIGVDVAGTFYPVVRLRFGMAAVFALGAAAPYAKANTAAVDLLAFIFDP